LKNLSDILYKVSTAALAGNTNIDINDVQIDSRKVQEGTLFVAVKGVAADACDFG